MADPNPPNGADAPPTDEPLLESKELNTAQGGGRLRRLILLCAGVAVIAAGAGYGAALFTGCGSPEGGTPPEPPADAADTQAPGAQFMYKDFETVTVNLDEPRLARYIRATVTVAILPQDFEAASKIIDEKMPVLKDWLTVYFASCSLDDVRGAVNLNRIRREVLDAFNTQLWPDQKPKISHILFKEFTVS